MEAAALEGDSEQYARLNIAFHQTEAAASRNESLQNLLRTLATRIRLLRTISVAAPGRLVESLALHHQLVAAYAARDGQRAEQVSHQLMEAAVRALVAHFERNGTYQPAPRPRSASGLSS
jgi:DNA-binding GntR family transcriptional regulator